MFLAGGTIMPQTSNETPQLCGCEKRRHANDNSRSHVVIFGKCHGSSESPRRNENWYPCRQACLRGAKVGKLNRWKRSNDGSEALRR